MGDYVGRTRLIAHSCNPAPRVVVTGATKELFASIRRFSRKPHSLQRIMFV